MNKKEDSLMLQNDTILSDNQYRILTGMFGVGLAVALFYAADYIISTYIFK
jgi:uncharacterized membrane protein